MKATSQTKVDFTSGKSFSDVYTEHKEPQETGESKTEKTHGSWWDDSIRKRDSNTVNLYNTGDSQIVYGSLGIEAKAPSIKKKLTKKTKSEVMGSINNIEEHSVVCEVYLDEAQNRTIKIKMPRKFFPEEIHQGSPVLISLEEDSSGIRRPRVDLRKPIKTDLMKHEDEKLEELIQEL